jgi:hypothetical protein
MMSWWSVGVSLWLLSWGIGLSARLMARAVPQAWCLFDGGES